jgi:oxalate decarboxylase
VSGGTATLPSGANDPAAPRYTVHIDDVAPERYAGGSRNRVMAANVPALSGIMTTLMTLEPGATRTPHWHQAVAEVCYVLDGQVEVGLVGPNGASQTDVLAAGDIAFVPINWLHYVSNVGDEQARVILFHDATTDLAVELSWALSGFPTAVLAASYGLDPADLAMLAGGDPSLIAGPLP